MSQSRKKSRSRSTKGNSNTNTANTSSNDPDVLLKKLDTLHTKTKQEQRSTSQNTSTNTKIYAVIIIIVVGMSGIVLMNQLHLLNINSPSNGGTSSGGQTNGTVIQSVGGFLKDTASKPIYTHGKVMIVFASAEYCPYCAMERWAIVMALSQFGSFTPLTAIVTPNNEGAVPSYTFYKSNYTSQKVDFEPVELESLNKTKLETPNQIQQILMLQYDSKATIPFLCISGATFQSGSGKSLNVNDFSGKSFSYVKNQVDSKSGALYNQIKTESGYIVQIINSYIALYTATTATTTNTTTTTTTSANATAFG